MEEPSTGSRRAPRLSPVLFAAAVFLALTVLLTWPQAARLASGMGDLWDAKLHAWIFHWNYHQTFSDPLDLFHGNIFHPARYTLAFSENQWGAALFGFPLFALGASTLLVYNVLFLLGMFLSALGAWALARYVTGDPATSLLAGLVYAFVPWRLAQIPHVQFQWGAFLPLLLLFLLRWLDGGRRRDLALFALFFAWNALTNVHYALFSGILVLVVLAWRALVSGWRAAGRRVRASLLGVAAAAIVVLPFYVPYARAAKLYGMKRSLGEVEFYSAKPVSFLVPGYQNKLWAPLTQRFSHPEGELFPGVLPVALAVYAVVALRRRPGTAPAYPAREPVSAGRRRAAHVFDALAVVSLAGYAAALAIENLKIGPISLREPGRLIVVLTVVVLVRLLLAFPRRSRFVNLADFVRRRRLDARAGLFVLIAAVAMLVALGGNTPYYRFAFRTMSFVFRAIRVPARGVVLLHIALGVLAAWGLSILLRRVRTRRERHAFVAAAMVLTIAEYRAAPIDFPKVPRDPAPVYRWLAGVEVPGAILELPIGFDYDAEHIFRSTAHWRKLINGYSGFAPRHYDELKTLFDQRPVPGEAWRRAQALDAAVLVFHPHEVQGVTRLDYARAVRRALTDGTLETLGSFPHDADRDFVFRVAAAPRFASGIAPGNRVHAEAEFRRLTSVAESELAPPIGVIDFPPEDAEVSPGLMGYGWALDDSGVAEVRVATELGPALPALLGGSRPDVGAAHPESPEAGLSGMQFLIPKVPPGPHTLRLTIVAKDGGETVLERRIRIR